MSAQRRIDAFLTLADEELHAALLLQQGAPRQAAYYVQQAAEKAVRALHNLGYMAALLPDSHPLRERVRGLDRHSGAATLYRCPAPGGRLPPPPDPDVLLQDLADLRSFLTEVRQLLRIAHP